MESDLLARLDERTKAIQNTVQDVKHDVIKSNEQLASTLKSFEERMNERMDNIEQDMRNNYVRKDEFSLVQKLVYGFVAVVVLAVIGALINTVLRQ